MTTFFQLDEQVDELEELEEIVTNFFLESAKWRADVDARKTYGQQVAEAGGMLCDCNGDEIAEVGWWEYRQKQQQDRSKQEMIELAREAAWLLKAAFGAALRVTP